MTTEKSPAEIWNEAVEAVAQHLETGIVHYQWNGNPRRPNNYRAAAADARTTPNPYGPAGPPPRESPEWAELCKAAEGLGEAVAKFQNAKDDYTTRYPKDAR
jgi:hypothetical protein